MAGAGVLAAWGALRAGAGLVRLATVKSQQIVAAKKGPLEVLTQALPEDTRGLLADRAWSVLLKTVRTFKPDVIALGPGLGVKSSFRKKIPAFLKQANTPFVLDADGLNNLAGLKKIQFGPIPRIITPHPGELSRLLQISTQRIQRDRKASAEAGSKRVGGVCLLKGAETLIAREGLVWKNTTGNEGMASGGMGDVLTGLIAGLWAQMKERKISSAFQAACLGAYLHGWAGDRAVREVSKPALIATDLVRFLPNALKRVVKNGRN